MTRTVLVALALSLVACGDAGNNSPSNAVPNNQTTGTNSGTNSTVPQAGDCAWGEFIAACATAPEPSLSGRAVGCVEYYSPTDPSLVTQEAVCADELWQTTGPCSEQGLSGRRPVGCCFEVDDAQGFYTRHCYYDDPANQEASRTLAQEACESAGFCWMDLGSQI